MSLFHFIRPEWFLAIFPLIVFYWLLQRLQLQNKSWQSFCDKKLLPYLFESSDIKQKKRPLFLFMIAGLLTITALAGPTWEKRPQPVFKKQSALIIVLDLSRSMDATDIKPSRVTRALHKIEDILQQRTEGQTALIVYAADAFTVTPLTEDTATISSQIKSLNTAIMPAQGSNTSKALELAHSLFKQTSQIKGHILLITDGINENAIKVTESLLSPQYTLSVLGVGSTDGAPIPLSSGVFLKDSSGAIVIPKVNQSQLKKLASTASGSFRFLTTDDSDILHLLKPLNSGLDQNQTESTELNTDTWFEAGPWLLLALLPLAAFAFRKGYLFFIVFFILPQPESAHAFELNQLWKNQNQQARELFQKNNAGEAAKLFSDKKWKAAAQYKSGQYKKALESYQQLDQSNPDILYNLANTQAQLGQYDKALENYNKLIEENPNHGDAKHNRDQVEKLQQKQDKEDSKDSSSKDNKDDASDKKSDEGQSSDDNKSDSDKKDSEQKSSDSKESDNKSSDKNKEKSQEDAKQQEPSSDKKNKDNAQESIQDNELSKEQQQANEQWLRRIPDDPGGLLRRKFKYQSQQRQNSNSGEQQW